MTLNNEDLRKALLNADVELAPEGLSVKEQASDEREGPLIRFLDTPSSEDSLNTIADHSILKSVPWLPWFLYQWVYKYQVTVVITISGLFAIGLHIAKVAGRCTEDGWCDDDEPTLLHLSEYIYISHFFLLCLSAAILPIDPFPAVQISDLLPTALIVVVYDVWGYFFATTDRELSDISIHLTCSLLWLALTLRLKDYLYHYNQKKHKCWLNIMTVASPCGAFMFFAAAAIVAMLLPCIASALFLQLPSSYITCVLSKVFPCLPIQNIKQMEMDASEREHEREDENQRKVDRQIAELGRPAPRTRVSPQKEQHKIIAVLVGLLGLWIFGFLLWYAAWIASVQMGESSLKTNH